LLKDKLAGEYVWLWAALLVSFLVYIPLFLWSMGYIEINNSRRGKGGPGEEDYEEVRGQEGLKRKTDAPSLALLAYPVAYTIVVLPVSIVRWATFTKHTVPDAATFFSIFLHDTFGAVNVILLLTTRQELLLFKDPREARAQHHATEMGRAPEVSPSRASSIRTVDEIRDADAQTNTLEPLEEDVGLSTGHPHFNSVHDDYHAAYELSARGGGRMRGASNGSAFMGAPSQ